MENILTMAKKPEIEKVRTGPKRKNPEDKAAPITVYSTVKDIADFGGSKDQQENIARAKAFCLDAFNKELAKKRK